MKRLLVLWFLLSAGSVCSDTYTIPLQQDYFDASKKGIRPGDTICIAGGERETLKIKNVQGDSASPVIIMACGGEVMVRNNTFRHGLVIFNSRYFRLTGKTDLDSCAIKILGTGPGASGVSIGDQSSDFEVDHLEISHTGFAGIMAKTDPRCDGSVNRGNFFMRNVLIHNNYIHDVGGEGVYAGNSFYGGWTANKECPGDTLFPHDVIGIKIYNNLIENTGWDGLQLGSASRDAEIYGNVVRNFGLRNIYAQNNGIQAGEGTTGIIARNIVEKGPGNGIILIGLGNNLVFDNLISGAEKAGIFCDDRVTEDSSVIAVFNNTFYNTGQYAVILYNEKTRNFIFNNVVIPGDSGTALSFIQDKVSVWEENNVTVTGRDIDEELYRKNFGSSVFPETLIPGFAVPSADLPNCGVNFLRRD